MSYRDKGEQEQADAERSPGMMRLFGQMILFPFTVFVFGIELFARTIRDLQRTTDRGMNLLAGEATPLSEDVPASEDQSANSVLRGSTAPAPHITGGWGDLKGQTTASTNDDTVGDAAEVTDKETTMRDKDLSDDQLKLIRYKILFVKRDYETAFAEREELVSDNMTGEAFTAWKIAEFIQRLEREELPEKWRKKNYPRKYTDSDRRNGKYYIGRFDDEHDKKYLRVYFEVLERYVREEDEDDEVDILREIRDAIKGIPTGGGTGTGTGVSASAGTGTSTGGTGGAGTGTSTGGTGGAGTGTGTAGSAGGGTGYNS